MTYTTSLMNQAFSDLFGFQRELDRYNNRELRHGSFFSRGGYPSVNLFEKNDDLVLTAELPGFQKGDIHIELNNNVLSLKGENRFKTQEGVSYHRRERDYGKFSRSIQLPVKVDAEKTIADFSDGILTVTLSKADEAKPRQIEVK